MSTSNNENFTTKAIIKHGNRYDYSLVEYLTQKDKIIIICPTHGEFEQTPKSHLRGKGCLLCGREIMKFKLTKTNTDFIAEASTLHNKFDYTKTDYVSAHIDIIIICPIHGEFEQSPSNHLKGHGCTYCTYNNNDTKWFIDKGNDIHNSKYDYSLVNYINNKGKVSIKCQLHGEFKQSPDHHINREHGCPACKESKGEIEIRGLLESMDINYNPQYKFTDCKNIKPLPFDFYLPDYNICIEYNGIQHYKPVQYFGGIDKFKKQQINDKLKKVYCDENNITLIIVRYNENIKNKLELVYGRTE